MIKWFLDKYYFSVRGRVKEDRKRKRGLIYFAYVLSRHRQTPIHPKRVKAHAFGREHPCFYS